MTVPALLGEPLLIFPFGADSGGPAAAGLGNEGLEPLFLLVPGELSLTWRQLGKHPGQGKLTVVKSGASLRELRFDQRPPEGTSIEVEGALARLPPPIVSAR